MTDKCARPQCDNELKHIEGRKRKKYCSRECKLRHWQQLNPVKKDKKYVRVPIEDYEKYQNVISKIDAKAGDVHESEKILHDSAKKSAPKAITTPKEALVEVKIPKNLQELKNMCPKNLGGVDKLLWLETEKVKYNF